LSGGVKKPKRKGKGSILRVLLGTNPGGRRGERKFFFPCYFTNEVRKQKKTERYLLGGIKVLRMSWLPGEKGKSEIHDLSESGVGKVMAEGGKKGDRPDPMGRVSRCMWLKGKEG